MKPTERGFKFKPFPLRLKPVFGPEICRGAMLKPGYCEFKLNEVIHSA